MDEQDKRKEKTGEGWVSDASTDAVMLHGGEAPQEVVQCKGKEKSGEVCVSGTDADSTDALMLRGGEAPQEQAGGPYQMFPRASLQLRGGAGGSGRKNVSLPGKEELIEAANRCALSSIGGSVPEFVALVKAAGPRQQPLPAEQQEHPSANQHRGRTIATSSDPEQIPADQPQQQPPPQPQPQPEGTCPSCHTGRGTVAACHLCRCELCPDIPVGEQCPFCVLAAVPKLRRQEKGTCPSCERRLGIPEPDHLCRCKLCRHIPDALCPHCELRLVPQPPARANGACPVCLNRAGTVATHHLCLCVDCKELPGAVCPFCTLASGVMPIEHLRVLAYSLIVFYSLMQF